MPVGNRIPIHRHEIEEVFFIVDGECLARCRDGAASLDLRLGRRDLVALPPFLPHGVFNTGPGECQLQTLLAKAQPLRPQYADPELLKLQAVVA
jgi:mannose-6-phosphate isomerase-like protein (cupin superfamily)